MNDAENLAKLLGHLKPERFHAFMARGFGLVMTELEKEKTKTEQRKAMEAVLATLPVLKRQRIEEVAEKIILLTDGAGQDVVEGMESLSGCAMARSSPPRPPRRRHGREMQMMGYRPSAEVFSYYACARYFLELGTTWRTPT